VPAALDQLTGPVRGDVRLPRALAWGPRRTFDVEDPDSRRLLYEVVVQEANSASELGEHLDQALLIELWPRLMLPWPCRRVWEDRFPELARRRAAA
jgi:hypothetical protein